MRRITLLLVLVVLNRCRGCEVEFGEVCNRSRRFACNPFLMAARWP